MARVLSRRVVPERRLREHREEARWQLARAAAWLERSLDPSSAAESARVSPNELAAARRAALKLRSEAGATRAELRALAEGARAYSDADYAAHAARLEAAAGALMDFAAVLAGGLLPFLERAADANAAAAAAARAAELRGGAAAAAAEARRARAAALRALGPPPAPPLELPPGVPLAAWRYPPRPYVSFRRKGLRGARAPSLAPAGFERPRPAPRRGVDRLPPPAADGGGAPFAGMFD